MGSLAASRVYNQKNRARLISVITPCFNASRTLRRAYDSLLVQDGEWQHIIVDDGSTDDSRQVMEALAMDPRVICFPTGGQRGPGAALNAGLRLAQGDLVAFLDADDEYLPDHLGSHAAAIGSDPGVDVFWGGVDVVAGCQADMLVPDVCAGFGLISVLDCVVQGTIFGRRSVFEQVRFSEDRGIWWQDYDFIRRASQQFRVERFHQPTYRYYRNAGGGIVERAKAAWPLTQSGWPARAHLAK